MEKGFESPFFLPIEPPLSNPFDGPLNRSTQEADSFQGERFFYHVSSAGIDLASQ
jgi:hypothetical protein